MAFEAPSSKVGFPQALAEPQTDVRERRANQPHREITSATGSPSPSHIPSRNAAVEPITTQAHGISMITTGGRSTVQSRRASVAIVVGHGSPNVGAAG